jgi:sulfur carrier protein ThiS
VTVAQVVFAKAVQRHVECPPAIVPGHDVRSVLAGYFDLHPAVRAYVLDERGAVRRHVAVFVDGTLITDRTALTDPVGDDDEVAVFQALSGGAT